jgi:hypothetical protein
LKERLTVIITGIALLASAPVYAETVQLSLTTRGLTPGAEVWIEVTPEYHEISLPSLDKADKVEPEQTAAPLEARHAWTVVAPVSGVVAPTEFAFTFPPAVSWTSLGTPPKFVPAILLKTRYRLDEPGATSPAQIHELTLGLAVPPGLTEVSRCLRLRAQGGETIVDLADDCTDEAFARAPADGGQPDLRPQAP